MTQTNMVSGTRRAARRHILAIDWRPSEVTTELSGVWREAIEDTRQHQPGQTIGSARYLIGEDMNISTMADAEMTMYTTEQPTVVTDSSRTATEHATSHNAAEQSVEAEEVIWQVKFESWQDLPREASAIVEAAHKEGRTDSGIYINSDAAKLCGTIIA